MVRTIVEMDYPPEEVGEAIVEIANNEKADLLVLGSRGLSEFKGMLLGSVSHKVLQRSDCPVLVIKRAEAALRFANPRRAHGNRSTAWPEGRAASS